MVTWTTWSKDHSPVPMDFKKNINNIQIFKVFYNMRIE